MWFIEKALKIFVFFICCILLFDGKLFCVEISSHGKLASSSDNPWIEYMKIFDIDKNHGSGVENDLGGEVEISNGNPTEDYKIRFPNGKCPIFGKVIFLENGHEFTEETNLEGFSIDDLLFYLKKGYISSSNEENHGINFPTLALAGYYDQFKNLESPIVKQSIYECAYYANKFEHNVTSTENLNNCFYKKTGSCIKHPFAYNLVNKKCYILFPLKQEGYINDKSGKIYYSNKLPNWTHFVYGSSSVVRNWPKICPVKPIKGALFGFWKDGQCKPINSHGSNQSIRDLETCVEKLFSDDASFKWANYDDTEGCVKMKKKPNCLCNSRSGYAVTSISIQSSNIYDLPPCIPASEKWEVEVSCKNFISKLIICRSGKWTTKDKQEITKCENSLTWANIKLSADGTEELISEEGKREISENESTNLNDMKQREGDSRDTSTTPATKNAAESWQTRAFLNSLTVFILPLLFM